MRAPVPHNPPWAVLLVVAAACRSAPVEPPGTPFEPPGWVTPDLEDVFLIPGVHGQPPAARALSADGSWLLFRWREMTEVDGRRTLEGGGTRLIAVDDPRSSRGRGELLAAVVERALGPGEEVERVTWAWSEAGHRLAVAARGGVHLLDHDGETWTARTLLAPPAESESESEDGDDEEGPRLGTVRSLEFAADDAELRVVAGRELYVLPVDAPAPMALAEVASPTASIDVSAESLQWSDDLSVAFSTKALGHVAGADSAEGDDPSGTPAATPEEVDRRGVAAHVLALDSGRLAALDGLAEIDDVQRARLSPDGRWVTAEEVDRTNRPEPTLVPDYLTARPSTRNARREWADDPPSPRRTLLWSTRTGARTELRAADEPLAWSRPVGWAPHRGSGPVRWAGASLSADYRTREIVVLEEGRPIASVRDHDERWFGGPVGRIGWTPDGERLVFGSESLAESATPGRCQLFALDVADGRVRQLTAAEGEVKGFRIAASGDLVFCASREDPARTQLGRVPAAALRSERSPLTRVVWLQTPAGWNELADLSRDGSRAVISHSELGTPAELWAVATGGEGAAWPLTDTLPAAFRQRRWVLPERIAVEAADGAVVRAHVFLPPGSTLYRPDRPRACVVFIHGAGYLQNVTDSLSEYAVNFLFHTRLANMGYVVLDVDYRGSRGYGRDFRTDVQFHLGGKDLDDIHLAVDELVARGVVDRERVGCYGGSYGGFLTLMALFTAPERWACGAALRSVTDWRTYHPGYTVPRLGRPSTHAEAYERSSPIDLAAGLRDPLLILHGMLDRNVFAQDSIRLIEALIDAGLDFDAMLYPSQGHGFTDGMHWLDEYRRIERFFARHLGRP